MCGIVGMVNLDGRAADAALLGRMNEAIHHRGPDEEGSYLGGHVGLAMRRLAIIDLKGGQQPIADEERTAFIVYNGEVYNFREVRKGLEARGHRFHTDCDTEVVLHAYLEYGADCPKHLRGMFAFAVWDERRRELFLARDRVGKKPLLYSRTAGTFVFGSEFSALLLHPSVGREMDRGAIHDYLSFMCVPAPQTAYRDIRKLEPGHTLTL
ncbi:MAG TPA: hypothetical protein VF654_01625, partial [Pyrinomonadaceae bacterium]